MSGEVTEGAAAHPSVVVASFRARRLLDQCLAGILPAAGSLGAQIIVARAAPPADARALAEAYPGLTVVPLAEGASVPEIRGAGIGRATGRFVAVTEDHCVPDPGWLDALSVALAAGADVVGGGMAHAPNGRVIDWAAYFSEYGFFSFARPLAGSGPPLVTGANVAYAASVAGDAGRWMREGTWENVVHDRLLAAGGTIAFAPGARVRHNHRYRVGAFCRDRFEHGRDYARDRLAERGPNRWVRLALTPLLPFVLLARIARASAGESLAAFLAASPLTLLFLGAWAAGEGAGYLDGPPDRWPAPSPGM